MNNTIAAAHQKIVDQEFPSLVKLLETHMNFEKWGFKQTFYGVSQEFAPSIIYDSKSCRVRFVWLPADIRDGPDSATLYITYGRLHASNQQRFMIWNGSNCLCWHSLDKTFWFLDGLSSQEAVEISREVSPFVGQFAQLNKGHEWSNIEWGVRLHSAIWEHYGDRLFDLFDLRHPDLWEQYTFFIKEFYRIKPRVYKTSAPSPESIC